jgi:hypothetical protein
VSFCFLGYFLSIFPYVFIKVSHSSCWHGFAHYWA